MIRLLPMIVLLAACSTGQRDNLTRNAARSAITPVVVQQFPGIPVEPAIDCIIDNASSGELIGLASDAVTGPTAATAQNVVTIASRPQAVQCLATNALPALLR